MISKSRFNDDASKIIKSIREKRSDFWSREEKKNSLQLFHRASKSVPAYKDFLKKNKVNPDKIKTYEDFILVPPVNKKDYLKYYPIDKLCWPDAFKSPQVFTSTSGSTGTPTYFPRSERLDWEASIIHQLFFENESSRFSKSEKTLIIVAFGMGVWIGGLITYKAFEIASHRCDYPVSILTPGINKSEIFKALQNLAPYFNQVILAGYPPFIKDVIDEAPSFGINVKKLNLKILTAAESFTEKFRDHILDKIGSRNPELDTMNIYGTADLGAMACETPISILSRRIITGKKSFFENFFNNIVKTPTLAQYNPSFISFEAQNGDLLITGDNTLPLIRYDIGDHGGVMSFTELEKKFKELGVDIKREGAKAGILNKTYELPFVYVYERKDLSTTLYGLQIYPEIIREALLDDPHSKFLTGKFSMLTKFDKKHNQYLEINIELKKDHKHSKKLREQVIKHTILNLRSKISEFRELHDYLKNRALPKIVFWPHEHPTHFKPGVKQKWVKK